MIEIKPSPWGEPKITPEQIRKINWVVFSIENGAPFNLQVFLLPYPPLIRDLLNSPFEPVRRWEFSREGKNNPLFRLKGSGFEGHMVGLPPHEMVNILKQEEKRLEKQNLTALRNINRPLKLKEAYELQVTFSAILARMRGLRTILQQTHPENRQYQDLVYNSNSLLLQPIFNIDADDLIIGIDLYWPNQKYIFSPPLNDIRDDFPLLAEIGRFGFPPLRVLLHHLSHYNLI